MTATTTTTRRLAAILLVAGAVLANVAFIGLGSVFDYPDVLDQPAAEVLAKFRADQSAVIVLFFVLALGAALLAPAAVLVGRLAGRPLGRWSARVGIAAAAVQVIGLLRWPLIVPWLADRATDAGASAEARADATDTFEFLNTLLGTVVGETFGYLLTALWTVLVVRAFRRRIAGRWFAAPGLAAAALILLGIAVPLDLPGADLANFVGYILWTLWLIAFAATLWRRRLADTAGSNGPATPPERPAAPDDSTPRAMSTNREALLMGRLPWRGRRLQNPRLFVMSSRRRARLLDQERRQCSTGASGPHFDRP